MNDGQYRGYPNQRYETWGSPQGQSSANNWLSRTGPRQPFRQPRPPLIGTPPNSSWHTSSGWQSGGVLHNDQQTNPANSFNRSAWQNDNLSQQNVSEADNYGYNFDYSHGSNSQAPVERKSFDSQQSNYVYNPPQFHTNVPQIKKVAKVWPPRVKTKKPSNSPPLARLNEENLSVRWNVIDGDGSAQPFVATAIYLNAEYKGTAMSKKEAMNNAARQVLIAAGKQIPPEPSSQANPNLNSVSLLYELLMSKKLYYRPEFVYSTAGPPFTCEVAIENRRFTGAGNSKKTAKAIVAQQLLEAFRNNEIPESLLKPAEVKSATPAVDTVDAPSDLDQSAGTPTLVQLNNLFVPQDIVWVFATESQPGLNLQRATLSLQGKDYTATEISKKAAKTRIASQILEDVEAGVLKPTMVHRGKKRPHEKAASDVIQEEPAVKKANILNSDENPISVTNQLCPGLQFNYTQEGPPHCPTFTVFVTEPSSGQHFTAQGESKKKAKIGICKHIVEAIRNGKVTPQSKPEPEPVDVVMKCKKMFGNLDWTVSSSVNEGEDPSVTVTTVIENETISGTASDETQATRVACEKLLQLVDSMTLQPKKTPKSDVPNSVLCTIQELFPDLTWEFSQTGPVHQPAFYAKTKIQEQQFEGISGSKKAAKNEACVLIQAAIESGSITPPPKKPKKDLGPWHSFTSTFGQPEVVTQQSSNSENNTDFIAKCLFNGTEYTASGPDEKSCKLNLATKMLEMLKNNEIQIPVIIKFKRVFKSPIDIKPNEDGFIAKFSTDGTEFEATDDKSSDAARDAVAAQALQALEDGKIAAPSKKSAPKQTVPGAETPLSILNQRYQKKVDFEVVQVATKILPFIVKAEVDGKAYQGSGRSKMVAKHACATVILSEVFNHHFELGQQFGPDANMDRGDIGNLNPQALSTKVSSLVTDKYNSLSSRLTERFSIRKVLAGCVLTIGDNLETAELITLAAGTKCIHGGAISQFGDAVNDMHAEILIRRALKRYLYDQIQNLKDYQPSIMELNDSKDGPPYKVTDGARFHLYISSPPCGDSRLFTVSNEQQQDGAEARDTNPNRINRGQLRVKVETGQGTIPINVMEMSEIQTYDGVMAGDRYLNMSCSDKVALWTLLGFQGSLLSKLVEPIYFSSVIIGSMFHQEHVYRGLYGRFQEIQPAEDIPRPFKFHCPEFLGTIIAEPRTTTKPPNHAVVWYGADDNVEILDTRNGKSFDGLPSRFCKKGLFIAYRYVCKGKTVLDYYGEEKKTAIGYQDLKKKLLRTLGDKKLGAWARKPPEQDHFMVKTSPPSQSAQTVTAEPTSLPSQSAQAVTAEPTQPAQTVNTEPTNQQ